MCLFPVILLDVVCRDARTLYVDPTLDGDCFSSPCSIKTAALVVRVADTLIFSATSIRPGSYPSEFSDLFTQLTLMNTTVVSQGTVVDGRFLAGDMLWAVTSHAVYTWAVFHNWTFCHFSKPIASREFTWSSGPFVVFRNCRFENCDSDLFTLKGGTIIFENCFFKDLSGRVIKAISEVTATFLDCSFENCAGLFFSESAATFVNCRFLKMKGQRGGAIYASKSTLFIDHCIFVNCEASINGGAVLIRESLESYESEIRDSCFVNTTAAVNGSAVLSYLSYLKVSGTCFARSDSLANLTSVLDLNNNTYDLKCRSCLTQPPAEFVEYDFSPVDTNKWFQFDELKSSTTIIIEEDDP
jgi:hypothetical protein